MTVRTETVPASWLTLHDQIWDPHPGAEGWRAVVSLAREGDDHLLVGLKSDPKPLRVACCSAVRVLRDHAEADAEEIEAEAYHEAVEASGERLSGSFSGDLAALTAAAAEHAARTRVTMNSEPGTHHPKHLHGWHAGDLAPIPEAEAARALAMARTAHRHACRCAVEDEQASNEAVEAVEDRMTGWYGGDLEAIIGAQH